MSNSRVITQKRIVKFVPTEEQRHQNVKEWQEVTPELSALLQRLDDRLAANAFIKIYGKKLQRLPPKNQLAIFPEKLQVKDLKNLNRLISNYICLPKKIQSQEESSVTYKNRMASFQKCNKWPESERH